MRVIVGPPGTRAARPLRRPAHIVRITSATGCRWCWGRSSHWRCWASCYPAVTRSGRRCDRHSEFNGTWQWLNEGSLQSYVATVIGFCSPLTSPHAASALGQRWSTNESLNMGAKQRGSMWARSRRFRSANYDARCIERGQQGGCDDDAGDGADKSVRSSLQLSSGAAPFVLVPNPTNISMTKVLSPSFALVRHFSISA